MHSFSRNHITSSSPIKNGFTLIELSIVMVVIGFIVGGVLVGRDLVAAATVRTQITQLEKYQVAVGTFRTKYGYIPGDIPQSSASNFGLPARVDPGVCMAACNCTWQCKPLSDGNGVIQGMGSSKSDPLLGEGAMFWVDLSTSKLINDSFTTGTTMQNLGSQSIDFSITASGLLSTQYALYAPRATLDSNNYIYVIGGHDMSNYFFVNSPYTYSNGSWGSMPIITVKTVYNIDKKIDDGLPGSGNVLAVTYWWSSTLLWATNPPFGNNLVTSDINGTGPLNPIPTTAQPGVYGNNDLLPTWNGTCFDNNNTAGVIPTYSIGKDASGRYLGNNQACSFSVKFQAR